MPLSPVLKEAAIATRVYGPLRRLGRTVFGGRNHREFERDEAFYRQFIQAGDLCFDVGGNIGAKAEAMLGAGARVVCFEPQPHCLREIKARCGPSHRLIAIQAAVGAAPGKAELYVSRNSAVTTLKADLAREVVERIETPVVSLDQAIAEHGVPRFCKIDVEGYELEVLRGLSQRIPVLSLEYHVDERDVAKTWECLERLATFGTYRLNATNGECLDWFAERWMTVDEFRDVFPERLRRPMGYGDIFLRYEN